MKIRNVLTAALVLATLGACTPSGQATATAVTAGATQVCEVVLTVADPALDPLCTTAADVEAAVQALVAQASQVEAGAPLGAAVAPKPSARDIYNYLVAHGAQTVKR